MVRRPSHQAGALAWVLHSFRGSVPAASCAWAAARMIYEVTVPTGCSPGDTFQVQVGAVTFDVTAPDGYGAGSTIEISATPPTTLALDDTLDEPDSSTVLEVEVPAGCAPGDEFLVEMPDGRTLEVVVPTGSAPGTRLAVALPADESLSGKPMESVHESSGVHSACADGIEEPADESGQNPDGFDFDDSFLIQRSDLSYSEGWLKEYDGYTDLYLVLIVASDRSGYKYVGREQIELNTVHF